MKKSDCEETKKKCDDDQLLDDDGQKLKCAVACCISDDVTPCNGAFLVSKARNAVLLMIPAILYSLSLF